MLELPLEKATVKKVGDHQYYIFPTTPPTHRNQKNRPPKYCAESACKTYRGKGSNGSAKLLPEIHSAANAMMYALIRYGEKINDHSMKSAVIQSGFRPDDASQGATYLRIIKDTIRHAPNLFEGVEFPASLEAEAQSVLGRVGDARRQAFHSHLAAAPGWNARLASQLFQIVDNVYAPRGSNPHSTGMVFDLDFMIYHNGFEKKLGAATVMNAAALRSAAGMWLNLYAMQFGFDSYDTGKEIWHQEYRSPKKGEGSPEQVELLTSCLALQDVAEPVAQVTRDMIHRVIGTLGF